MNQKKMITSTILSMSLLTVMAGAAIAPALDIIHRHFADAGGMQVQLILSLPALFIILTNVFFLSLSRRFGSRTLAVAGLTLYVAAGAGCYFIRDINLLLAFRALLGVSVGVVMPLSTGLLSYYFPPEQQARLMGYSAAMNQLGGVVATLLAGLLAIVDWNYCFLVYLLGVVALGLVVLYLPNERIGTHDKQGRTFTPRHLLKFHPSVVGMLLVMLIFFIYPTNFALVTRAQTSLSLPVVTVIMCALDLVAFGVGMSFGGIMKWFRRGVKYFAPVFFAMGFAAMILWPDLAGLSLGSCLTGIAVGVGVPYLNTIASIKGGKTSATTVMPLLSIALYLGQFLSPVVVASLSHVLFGQSDVTAPYKVGLVLCGVFLIQLWATRHYQSLPPE